MIGHRKERKRLWITWETQRRNWELAQVFQAEYCCFDFSIHSKLIRYLASIAKTIFTLARARCEILFCQNPSIVLGALAGVLKPLLGYRLVVDAHNSVFEAQSSFARRLVKFCFRRADFVIVSNEGLSSTVRNLAAQPLILPDRLPAIPARPAPELLLGSQRPVITLIATFAADEPIEAFLNAVRELDGVFTLFVTGKRERAGDLLRFESDGRIRFTGFLRTEEFEALLLSSDLLVDLTTRENCLVCGAYEALAVQRPVLLSDTEALRRNFPEGTLFAANDRRSYQLVLASFLKNQDGTEEARTAGAAFDKRWQERFRAAESAIFGP